MIVFENKLVDTKVNEKHINRILNIISNNNFTKVLLLLDRVPLLLELIKALYDNKIAFIPVDPKLPYERILYIISDCEAHLLIMQDQYKNFYNNSNKYIVDSALYFPLPTSNALISPKDDIAYIIYTSGSTGKPKGVEITAEGFESFSEGISKIINISACKSIACLTTVSFDIFLFESLYALLHNMTVVLANDREQKNPRFMTKLIRENDIDILQMTPSMMQMLINYDNELTCLSGIKELLIGGEAFPKNLLRILQKKTKAEIHNMYGLTEATIWATSCVLTNSDEVYIGEPLENVCIHILDNNLNFLPAGEMGEIGISGRCLAKSYVKNDDLTNDRFITSKQAPGLRIYRTGDIGRYLPDGNLEYIGRIDNQIKIRGNRIEPEEIEFNLNQYKGILQSMVIAQDTSEIGKALIAFYVSNESEIDRNEILDFLLAKLPEYMIPIKYIRIPNFVYTNNGKIDRRANYFDFGMNESTENYNSNNEVSGIVEFVINAITQNSELNVGEKITLNDQLLSLGIDSLSYIKIIVAIEEEYNFEFDDKFMQVESFADIIHLVQYIESKVNYSAYYFRGNARTEDYRE